MIHFMEPQTHFFFAVRLPEAPKIIMKEHCERMKNLLPFGRWVHFEDLHITLAFLGFSPLEKLEDAKERVKEALFDSNSFPLQINQLGIFGDRKSPRILWADTLESKELQSVRNKVYSACGEAGFQLETRPFRPHITIARKWVGDEPFQEDLLHIWEELQTEPLAFEAKDIVLYQTHLQNTPKYEAKAVFPLI
jgi:2'-5' RNA ligase